MSSQGKASVLYFAAITNYNTLSSLNNIHLLSWAAGGQKSEMNIMGLKPRHLQGYIPSRGLRKQSISPF